MSSPLTRPFPASLARAARAAVCGAIVAGAPLASAVADDAGAPPSNERVSVFGSWTTARVGFNRERAAQGPGQPEISYWIPAFTFESDRGVFADFEDGIGAAFAKLGPCAAAAAVGYTFGVPRRERPPGLGSIPDSLDARLSVGCTGAAGEVDVGLIDEFGGTRGRTWAFTWAAPTWKVPRTSERLTLDASLFALRGDQRRTRAWFGVTPEQSLASGLPVYDAASGWMQGGARVDGELRLTRHVELTFDLEAGRVTNRFRGSPVIDPGWQVGTAIGLAYRWR